MKPVGSIVTVMCMLGSIFACSRNPPTQQASQTAAAIRAAQEVGAQENAKGAYYLQLAQENENHARVLMRSRDDDNLRRARNLLKRAEADADLALALAREDAAKADAERARDRLHLLEQGMTPEPAAP